MAEGPPYRLHVAIDRGQGPVYVLLHGINSTGHDWDTVVTAMGFDHRCIALDELGYGNSPQPLDIDYTVDDHADAIDYTLTDIGIDEPFTLVGYSMGGPMAARFAAKYPDRVKRLVLISAPFFLDPEQMGEAAYAKAVFQTEGSHKLLDMVRSVGFAKSGVFKKLSADDKQVIQGFINAQDLNTDWTILQKNMANAIQHTNMAENLSQVRCPITFMVGEHDAFIVQSQIETLAEKFAPEHGDPLPRGPQGRPHAAAEHPHAHGRRDHEERGPAALGRLRPRRGPPAPLPPRCRERRLVLEPGRLRRLHAQPRGLARPAGLRAVAQARRHPVLGRRPHRVDRADARLAACATPRSR